MTGWRLGYIAGPKHFVSACGKIQSQVCYITLVFLILSLKNLSLVIQFSVVLNSSVTALCRAVLLAFLLTLLLTYR